VSVPLAQAYEQDVVGWILEVLSYGEVSWSELLRALPGVYPSLVLVALRGLAEMPRADPIARSKALELLESTRREESQASEARDHRWEANGRPLPVPHPLDYEWRFSPEAVELLLRHCEGASERGDTIALVGAPTLLIGSAERRSTRSYVLLDRNRSVVSLLLEAFPGAQVFVFDACQDPPPDYKAAVTVLDPPWYEAHFRGFLWSAAQMTAPGGRVLLSLPAVGTRPGIREERTALLGWAEQLGLALVAVEEGVLPYVTPPFERNALRAEGITSYPADWRRGDLATFTVQRRAGADGMARPPAPVEALQWSEVSARGVRVRFKPNILPPCSPRDLSLHTIVLGDVLPSVSSRDSRRSLATVWTSGNRVFRSEHPLLLRSSLLDSLRAADPEEHASYIAAQSLPSSERRQLRDALLRLLQVIRIEQEEYLIGIDHRMLQ
jgi:hypothetical protein